MRLKLNFFFLTKLKKWVLKTFVFYVIAFDPIEIQTCLAPQNDRQNLSFVKDNNVFVAKMTRNGLKMAN